MRPTLLLSMVFFIATTLSAQPLVRYDRVSDVRSITGTDGGLWLATVGGLYLHDLQSPSASGLIANTTLATDIALNHSILQDNGTLWISTDKGYLYSRSSRGRFSIYSDFWTSGADITSLYTFDSYLLVGHSQGLTLFDPQRGRTLYTLQNIEGASQIAVRDIIKKGDSLFISWTNDGSQGVALFDSVDQNLNSLKFTDAQQWTNGSSATTSIRGGTSHFSLFNATLYTLNGPARIIDNHLLMGTNDSLLLLKSDLSDSASGYARYRNGSLYNAYGAVQSIEVIEGSIFVGQESGGLSSVTIIGDSIAFTPIELGGIQEHAPRFVYTDREGNPWFLPAVAIKSNTDTLSNGTVDSTPAVPSSNSVTTFKDGSIVHTNSTTTGFGSMGDGFHFSGFTQGQSGAIYLGNNGSAIKKWDGQKWQGISIDIHNESKPVFKTDGNVNWQKTDGLATDSSGSIWSTIWHPQGTDNWPGLFVMSEDGEDFNYLFKQPGTSAPPFDIAVDSKGTILTIFGSTVAPLATSREYLVIDGSKSPFSSSESELMLKNTTHRNNLLSLSATSLGSILVGTDNGVHIFRQGTQSSLVVPTSTPQKLQGVVTSVAAQQSRKLNGITFDTYRIETLLWAAIKNVGPTQLRLIETIDTKSEDLISVAFDTSFSIVTLTEAMGLPKREVTVDHSLAIDFISNTLWIADGVGGITSYGIQMQPTALQNNSALKVFPNPYSHKSHSRIKITAVAPGGFIDIYSADGRLIRHLDQNSGDLIEEGSVQWTFQWRVPKGIAPGVYYIIAKNTESQTSLDRSSTITRKVIIVP